MARLLPSRRVAAAATEHPHEAQAYFEWLKDGTHHGLAIFADMVREERGDNPYSDMLTAVAADQNPAVLWFYRHNVHFTPRGGVSRERILRTSCQRAWAEAMYVPRLSPAAGHGRLRFRWERDFYTEDDSGHVAGEVRGYVNVLPLWIVVLEEYATHLGTRREAGWWPLDALSGLDFGSRVPVDDLDGNGHIPECRVHYTTLAMPHIDTTRMPAWMVDAVDRTVEYVVVRQFTTANRDLVAAVPEMPSDIWLSDDGANVRDDCEAYGLDASGYIRQTSVNYKGFLRASVRPSGEVFQAARADLLQQMRDVMNMEPVVVTAAPKGYMKTMRRRRAEERAILAAQRAAETG